MTARIIDGKALSKQLREGFKTASAPRGPGRHPGLAVILVGDNPASRVYVGNKVKACEECGVRSFHIALPATRRSRRSSPPSPASTPTRPCMASSSSCRCRPTSTGARCWRPSAVHKDVDGFHLYNVGGLVVGNTIFPPCTPYGVQLLLDTTGTDVAGKNVVVVGASNIVGKPMALMLLQREATVTICHAKTRDLAQHTILADILIVAAGKPGLIVPQMVKQGAIVIDVGINRLPDGKIVGDVDFEG
jgi:methylenetetrahydrofolate dehydrogenase (NADP+)/methenyltetrahydrofolate cyclohydrolase